MKTINFTLFFLLTVISFSIKAQNEWVVPYNAEKKTIIYEEVIQVNNVSKDDLYKRAIEWINTYFTGGANKISEKDAVNGFIKLKDRTTIFRMEKKTKVVDVVIDYNIEIYLKEGKFKFIVYNFRNFQGSTSPGIEIWMDPSKCEKEKALERYTTLNTQVTQMLDNLKQYMLTGSTKKDDNW